MKPLQSRRHRRVPPLIICLSKTHRLPEKPAFRRVPRPEDGRCRPPRGVSPPRPTAYKAGAHAAQGRPPQNRSDSARGSGAAALFRSMSLESPFLAPEHRAEGSGGPPPQAVHDPGGRDLDRGRNDDNAFRRFRCGAVALWHWDRRREPRIVSIPCGVRRLANSFTGHGIQHISSPGSEDPTRGIGARRFGHEGAPLQPLARLGHP